MHTISLFYFLVDLGSLLERVQAINMLSQLGHALIL